jgi:hypothetical protein
VLVLAGLVFLAQGLGKALDPTGYMAALERFQVLHAAAFAPLSLGALALGWTVLELLASVAMLYGGLSRAPAKQLLLGGLVLAFGLSFGYLMLGLGAFARGLTIANCTCFGSFFPQRLTWAVIGQEALMLGLLGWLFARTARWPSLAHEAARSRTRTLSHA